MFSPSRIRKNSWSGLSGLLLILIFSVASPPSLTMASANTLCGMSVTCINTNSLNMASANKPAQLKKLHGILKLRSDIILLSDIWLSNKSLVSSSSGVSNIFRNNQFKSYCSYLNSTKNKRGVGNLISNSVVFSELGRCQDPEENYLILKLRINENIVILGAVYGPNQHDPEFF
jgi:hypothetical protein